MAMNSDELSTSDIARLLGISRPRVWQLRKRADFPEPVGRDAAGRDYWEERQILRWAAHAGRELAQRVPLLYRPIESGRLAPYLGLTMVDGYVVLLWDTEIGRIGMIYAPRGLQSGAIGQVLDQLLPRAGANALVGMDAGHHNAFGPELCAADAATGHHYWVRWTDLAQAFGAPAPFWPSNLVQPEQMAKWAPGAPQAELAARHPELDTETLYRLAADSDTRGSQAQSAMHLARAITAQATRAALWDVEFLDKAADRDAITVAATPLEPSYGDDEPSETTLRDGWSQILARADGLAGQCVDLARQWDGGRYFPYSETAELRPEHSAEAAAWAATLKQAAAHTAAYRIFGRQSTGQILIDPATDLPAIKTPSGGYRAAVPQRLPATAPLEQVVLRDHQVWIRTADGTLYLAPEQSGAGLTWGYRGSGPLTLALLLHRLLNDINAPAPHISELARDEAPDGLFDLIKRTPRDEGTIYTRDQLVDACQN